MTRDEIAHSIGDDLLGWAGIEDDDDQAQRFAEALQWSSIPEACEAIAENIPAA